jgi:hypothetical protein
VPSQKQPLAERVMDSIPRVDGAVAVGEDLDFQRRWWRFENAAWFFLALILFADALGLLGRGWLARADRVTKDGAVSVQYERVERAGTPSEMTLEFGPDAIHAGQIKVFVSETVVKELGAQRIIPQPAVSEISPGGITYTFPVTGSNAIAEISLEPSFPGIHHIVLRVSGSESVTARILVLP